MPQKDKIVLRKSKLCDISEICRIENESFSAESWSRKSFEEFLSSENNIMLSAEFDSKIAGYILVSIAADEAELLIVASDKPHRRKGIADMLIKEALKQLCGRAGKFYLEVRESNLSAVNLYIKNGFEKVGLRKNYYSCPKENALIMSRDINGV